ncbi:MAG: ABC transporter permease [Planctomycetes bacterium]|nr:ABC transporter permease [Planctomycetota bacterium]
MSQERRGIARAGSWLRGAFAPFVGLFVVVALFTVYGWVAKPESQFLSAFRMALIAKQTAIVGVTALGATLVVLSGGIDLSVGSMLALCTVVLAQALAGGVDPLAALGLTLAVGAAAGAVNGLLVTRLRLVPFLATLGTMLLFRGLAEEIAAQQKIPAPAPAWLGGLLDPPAPGSAWLVCDGVWIVAALALVLAFVVRRTVFGRHVVAVGSNAATARLCGVPVARVQMVVYALGGLLVALGGVFEFANLSRQGNPMSGVGLELEAIAAVVLGGASLGGGRGSIVGAMAGALLMTTLRSGCVYAEVPDPLQKVLIGGILLAAIAVDRRRAGASP